MTQLHFVSGNREIILVLSSYVWTAFIIANVAKHAFQQDAIQLILLLVNLYQLTVAGVEMEVKPALDGRHIVE